MQTPRGLPAIEREDDPERSAFAPPPPSETPEHLRALHRRATCMRPQEWLEQHDLAVLAESVARPLLELLEQAVDGMRTLMREAAGVEPDLDFDEAWGEEAVASSGIHATTAPRSPHLGDIAFTAQLELGDAARRLRGKLTESLTPRNGKGGDLSTLEVAVECDRARRKLRRCIEAVLCAAPAVLRPSRPPSVADDPVRQAILVRAAYTRFRKTLPECDPRSQESVFSSLRTCANAVAKLLGGPAFEHVRHSDRAMLRALQERIVTWGRAPDLAEGVLLHKDFVTTADLLRGINLRQELQAYDDMTIAHLAGMLEMKALAPDQRREVCDLLESLFGRDDELDALASALRSEWSDDTVEKLVALLGALVPSTKLFPLTSP